MKYNTKAIVTIPAWAEALHEGGDTPKDTINSPAAAYAFVPLVYRAVRLRADALANTPIRITKKGNDETEVDWPFPDIDLKDLIWKSEAALCLSGANFIEKLLKSRSRKVGGLQWVNPTTMSVHLIADASGKKVYEFQQGSSRDAVWTLDDMIYMREFSLRDDVGMGDSATKVSLNDAALIRYMSRFAARFFETGAMPITVLQIEGLVDPDESKRIENFFKRAATRIRNAFNVLALNRTIEPKIVSQPIKDLVMPELNEQARHAVSLAFGIPQTMLEDAANFATSKEHRLSFWQDTMQPRGLWMQEQFNHQLLNAMGLEMQFAFEELDVFQEDENERSASLAALVDAINKDAAAAQWAFDVLGYELTEEQKTDLQKIIDEKKKAAPVPPPPQTNNPNVPNVGRNAPNETVVPAPTRAVWMDDLYRWERKALRVLDQTGSPICEYTSDVLPEPVRKDIESGLPDCKEVEDVRALFRKHIQQSTITALVPEYHDDTKELAESINRLADAYFRSMSTPNVNVTLPPITMTANLPEQKAAGITFAPVIQPTPIENNVTVQPTPIQNNVEVQPTAIENKIEVQPADVVNNVTVQPADVNIDIPKIKKERQKVTRDKTTGLINSTTTEMEYEE